MAQFKRPTTTDLINNGRYGNAATGTIIETLGFIDKGDRGAGEWRKTGVTGLTASQTPAQLVDAKCTDALGHEWELVQDGSINCAALGWDVAAGFAAVKALAGSVGDQYPTDDQVALYLPSYRYNEGGSLITLQLERSGLNIVGDGVTTQLENIQIEMYGAARCNIKDFMMRGALGYGITSNDNGGGFKSRQNEFNGIYIRDKTTGVICNGSTWNTWNNIFVEKCSGNGWECVDSSGEQISNSYSISNTGKGLYCSGGAEFKFSNFLTMNNGDYGIHLYGTDASTVVEHYFTNVTATEQQSNRTGTITSIVNSSGNIQVTVANHRLAAGMTSVVVSGTTNYNGTFNVDSVIDDNNFVLDSAYVSDEASGTISLPNWDLVIEADSTNQSRVNDQFFTGGNINYTWINKAFNIQFNGTRLKDQFYIEDSTPKSSMITRLGMGRGRNEETFSTVEASGDTTGLVEEIISHKTGAVITPGDELIKKRAGGAELDIDDTGVRGSTFYSGTSGVIADDTAYSFTPQFSRGWIRVSNGAGQNARMVELAYDTDAPNTGIAGYQGSVMEIGTGVYTGTTGTDTKITVSAANDGNIYIENRSGANQTMYWSIQR
jgi:hypothetical protein